MAELMLNGYLFQNEEDVDIAREELNKMQYISEKLTDEPEAVLQVYTKMLESRIFVTPIGMEYLRQMQSYLLKSPEIADERIQDIPVLIAYKEALTPKKEAPEPKSEPKGRTIPEEVDEGEFKRFKRKYQFALTAILVLAAMIVAMFVISLNSNAPTILNYRTVIENEYSDWAQQLSEKEAELRERENTLQNP